MTEKSLWDIIVDPSSSAGDDGSLRDQADRFAGLVSPVLADWLLAPAVGPKSPPLIAADRVAESRLIGRFALSQHRQWVSKIAAAGFDPVYMKGFAAAHSLYPDPVLRMQGDLDLLIPENDMPDLVSFLTGHGFAFRPMPVNPWGMISDASYFPFVSDDGHCDIDIHIQPDCFPVHRSLSVDRMMVDAIRVDAGGTSIAIPNRDHAFLLCVTNAAKDKFGIYALRKIIDAMVILRDHGGADWSVIQKMAQQGGFAIPTRAFCLLLNRLGVDLPGIPNALVQNFTGWRAAELDRVVAEFRTLFPAEPGLAALLRREWTIGAEPAVALHNLGLRVRGVFRPVRGVPAGGPVNNDFHVERQ